MELAAPDGEPITRTERETLKSVYRLTNNGGSAGTGDVADALGVTPGTVTAIMKRLDTRGLVTHRRYRGVALTEDGRRIAVAAIRRHRIVERFLADMLGYAWNEADRLAMSFEHELPQEVEDRLYAALDRPATCPHGFPIPEREADDVPQLPPLYALEVGDKAVVAVPGSTEPEVMAFLETLGIVPGVEVEIQEKHPFDGPLVVRVRDTDRTLSQRVAQQVFVQPHRAAEPKVSPATTPLSGSSERKESA